MDWFFFGGERTLDDGKSADYISHSNKFPQQSALLGMIRYQLLKQHNLLSQFPYTENKPTEKEIIFKVFITMKSLILAQDER